MPILVLRIISWSLLHNMKEILVRVESELFKFFKEFCKKDHKNVSKVIRELMQNYVDESTMSEEIVLPIEILFNEDQMLNSKLLDEILEKNNKEIEIAERNMSKLNDVKNCFFNAFSSIKEKLPNTSQIFQHSFSRPPLFNYIQTCQFHLKGIDKNVKIICKATVINDNLIVKLDDKEIWNYHLDEKLDITNEMFDSMVTKLKLAQDDYTQT